MLQCVILKGKIIKQNMINFQPFLATTSDYVAFWKTTLPLVVFRDILTDLFPYLATWFLGDP